MKLAIVYDWIDKWGGAERILSLLFSAFPEADLYTLYTDYKGASWAKSYQQRIRTTFVNGWYRVFPSKELLAPLMPIGIESLNLSKYDTVLSLSSSFSKGVLTRPETKHLCYLFSPTRFLWHERSTYFRFGGIPNPFLAPLTEWDYLAAQRPDQILTLSRYDQKLIKKFYNREAEILLPPFDPDYWLNLSPTKPKTNSFTLANKNYYLFVGRLESYKKVALLLEAFAGIPREQLVVVGRGSEKRRLERLAPPNSLFLEDLSDQELAWLYQNATALIMPQSEDFGYTTLESLVFKTPVLSYLNSGAAEYLKHLETGYLFEKQTVAGIREAVAKWSIKSYNFRHIDWKRFGQKQFLEKLKSYLITK